jgi:large subunit ribosomal protein L23e
VLVCCACVCALADVSFSAGSGAGGSKFKVSLGLNVAARINCADNSGAKNLYIISVGGWGARLNRLPKAAVGDMVLTSVKKGKPELKKTVHPAVVIRQRKAFRRRNGTFIYFEGTYRVVCCSRTIFFASLCVMKKLVSNPPIASGDEIIFRLTLLRVCPEQALANACCFEFVVLVFW